MQARSGEGGLGRDVSHAPCGQSGEAEQSEWEHGQTADPIQGKKWKTTW